MNEIMAASQGAITKSFLFPQHRKSTKVVLVPKKSLMRKQNVKFMGATAQGKS
jgi:hypothetical protein